MEVTLTPELEAWVAERVKIGDFKDAHNAVVTAVAMLKMVREEDEQWEMPAEHQEEVRRALEEENGKRGELVWYTEETGNQWVEDVKARGRERLARER